MFTAGVNFSFDSIVCFVPYLETIPFQGNGLTCILMYSKTCLKRPLKKKTKNHFQDNYCLMQVKSIAECSQRAFCNTFDPH